MELYDIKAKKKELEEKLLELFTEFELETGVHIMDVEVESVSVNTMTCSLRTLSKIKIKVEL